jgi:hypothetical protein
MEVDGTKWEVNVEASTEFLLRESEAERDY